MVELGHLNVREERLLGKFLAHLFAGGKKYADGEDAIRKDLLEWWNGKKLTIISIEELKRPDGMYISLRKPDDSTKTFKILFRWTLEVYERGY